MPAGFTAPRSGRARRGRSPRPSPQKSRSTCRTRTPGRRVKPRRAIRAVVDSARTRSVPAALWLHAGTRWSPASRSAERDRARRHDQAQPPQPGPRATAGAGSSSASDRRRPVRDASALPVAVSRRVAASWACSPRPRGVPSRRAARLPGASTRASDARTDPRWSPCGRRRTCLPRAGAAWRPPPPPSSPSRPRRARSR